MRNKYNFVNNPKNISEPPHKKFSLYNIKVKTQK